MILEKFETRLEKQIVRYSERYLCSCISEYLWSKENDRTVLDYFISNIKLKNVENTSDITTIEAAVELIKTCLENGRTIQKREKYGLRLCRARYPGRLKQKGKAVEEKTCPNCGSDFTPDEDGHCSYCGYNLKEGNAKWRVIEEK